MDRATFPRLDECITLYQDAYAEHGTDPFAPDTVELDSSDTDRDRLFELSIAYGLLRVKGETYQVTCPPDASGTRWETAITAHGDRIVEALDESLDRQDAPWDSDADRATLTYEGDEYASVTVEESDDFAAVVEAVAAVKLAQWAGVVLRSPGEYANEVQRFADRLGDPSALADTPLSSPLSKEYSDVTGTSKNELEFQIFLSTP